MPRVDQDDEGLAVVLVEEPAGDLREEVLRVVDLCPSRSLRVLG
ncbi:ferredoxin [Streptomyces hygroscopicus]